MERIHTHLIEIYYEDTDFSGLVYHANYLRYFERAREHLLGRQELVRLWEEDGVGFVVYRASLRYREGARFGDTLEIRTRVEKGSPYRAVFRQDAWRAGGERPLVEGEVELCCIDRESRLIKLPDPVIARIEGLVHT